MTKYFSILKTLLIEKYIVMQDLSQRSMKSKKSQYPSFQYQKEHYMDNYTISVEEGAITLNSIK